MPNVSTHRWTMCPPFEFELKYTLCSRLGGLDFLGALHQKYRESCEAVVQMPFCKITGNSFPYGADAKVPHRGHIGAVPLNLSFSG